MSREVHVRFWERVGVKFPRATRFDMVTQARDSFGGLHIMFNPAGILRDRMFHKMSPEDWQVVMDVHLNGHFNFFRAGINLMREQEYGRLIMVG